MESRQVHKNEQISKIEFTQLRTLTLQCLPRLTRFGFNTLTPDMRLQEILAEDDPLFSFIPFFSENVELPMLENLKLCFINIECRWLDQLPAVSASCQTLGKLIVEECNGLNFLFSYSMVKSLVQLRELVIRNCKSMERIINIEESAEEERIINMIFPKLSWLHLKGLPKLTGFGSGNSIEFPSLEALGILDCPRLKMFFPGSTCTNITVSKEQEATNSCADIYPLLDKKVLLPSLRHFNLNSISSQVIWHSQLLAASSSLKNLHCLSIVGLGDLKYLFSSSMANSVVQLNTLKIIDCKLMEAVIVEEEKGSSVLLFPNLQNLTLRNLPKLVTFCYFNRNLIDPRSLSEQNMTASEESSGMDSKENLQANIQPLFDEKNLHSISVQYCDSLKSLFPVSVARGLVQLEVLTIHSCMMEEITSEDDRVGVEAEAVLRFRFPLLTKLELWDLSRLKSFYLGSYISEWPVLKTLEVRCCNEVEILASQVLSHGESRHEIPTGQPLFLVEKVPFPSLKCLALDWNCIKKEMLHGKFPEYLCKLNYLELAGPFKETAICPSCFLHKLPNLETLSIYSGFLKELLLCEGLGCKEKHTESPDKLSYLKLCHLSDLHMWEESSEFGKNFQNVKRIRLSLCGNLKSLMPSSMTFENLTTLEVYKCGGLLDLMATSVAKSLVQLTRMDITDCEMIQEIITHKEDEAVDRIIFNRLEYLGLNCLPSLTVFYSGSWTIEFPSLQKVVVKQCPNMKLFSCGVLSTPRLHTLQIAETEDVGCWEGDLNTTIEQQYIEKKVWRSDENLSSASSLPQNGTAVSEWHPELFRALGSCLHLRCEVVVGGMDRLSQARNLVGRPHVVIATPGRIKVLLEEDPDIPPMFLKTKAPAFISVDEIDAIAGRQAMKDPRRRATFEALIAQLDSEKEKTDIDRFSLRQAVIFICATNRPDELDLEFVRTGRIDRHLYIGLPDAKQRVQIFGVHSAGKQLAEDVNFEEVSFEKKRLLAVHEAGHILLALLFPRFDWHAFSQLLPGGKVPFVLIGNDFSSFFFHVRASMLVNTFLYSLYSFPYLLMLETAISVFFPREDMVDQGYTTFGYMKMQMVVAHGGCCAEPVVFGDGYIEETEELAMNALKENRHILDIIAKELLEKSRITGLNDVVLLHAIEADLGKKQLEEFECKEQDVLSDIMRIFSASRVAKMKLMDEGFDEKAKEWKK
ncbi:hypothetical protein QYF36_007920 [Acer negundo]|nr:hypothetical protein QYF36_007920 [Acer negundo]